MSFDPGSYQLGQKCLQRAATGAVFWQSLHLLSLEGGLQCAELPLMGVLGGVLGASIPFPC